MARVAQMLARLPGTGITAIRGGEATRARLLAEFRSGDYDAIHFAGHAFFDTAAPASSESADSTDMDTDTSTETETDTNTETDTGSVEPCPPFTPPDAPQFAPFLAGMEAVVTQGDDDNPSALAAAIVLEGELVFAEYSAENGDPTEFDVDEPRCTGEAVFGHGRGTCQWGTQRWALAGRDHAWMMTHYYPGASLDGAAFAAHKFPEGKLLKFAPVAVA